MPLNQDMLYWSYTKFVKSIEMFKKHRPFKTEFDLIPKIG